MNPWRWIAADEIPPDAAARSLHLSTHGPVPLWLVLILALLAAAGISYLYHRESTRVSLLRRGILAGLRTSAVALLLFLLVRPMLVAEFTGTRPRGIALLVDNSQSMTQVDQRSSAADRLRVAYAHNLLPIDTPLEGDRTLDLPTATPGDQSRADLVRAIFGHPRLRLRDTLADRGPVRGFLFGRRISTMNDPTREKPDPLPGFTADEPVTAFADALAELLRRTAGNEPAAVIAFTDGRDNGSAALLADVAMDYGRIGVPLHIVGIGATDSATLELREFVAPETIFPEDTVAVPVRWSAKGLKQGTVQVVLTLGGREVARQDETVNGSDGERETVLRFTPEKGTSGMSGLGVTIRVKGEERLTETQTRQVRVAERKVRLLYVENTPRWEYKFLQAALLRDRRVEAHFYLIEADNRATDGPILSAFPVSRREMFTYDLVILGDIPAEALGAERLNWIKDFVAEGGGLVQIAGRQHAPFSYPGTPLAEMLPVEFRPMRFTLDPEARTQPFQPVLTPAGSRNSLMMLADTPEENKRLWDELPGLLWYYPVSGLRPGAVSLLAHPRERVGQEAMPLIAQHYYGKGLVLFLATDETWRWRYNTSDTLYGRFWGQVAYQLGLRHLMGSRQAEITLETSENVVGRPTQMYARLFDDDYRPLTVDRVTARLQAADGTGETRTLTLEAVPGQPGEFRTVLSNDRPGRFVIKLARPQSPQLDYRVDLPIDHELSSAGLAEEPLREAARLSGGRFYREEDLHALVESVEPRSAPFSRRSEVLLWGWMSFLLFLALVTAEWVVRKFSDLS